MQRHQSNPFLAGWEPDEIRPTAINNNNNNNNNNSNNNGQTDESNHVAGGEDLRRHSIQATSGNEDDRYELQNLARRSSSLENHSASIAKMRAEFESAIAGDTQYQDSVVVDDESRPSFDPFATIVDDDNSCVSSNSSASAAFAESRHNIEQQQDRDLSSARQKIIHQTIPELASHELGKQQRNANENVYDDEYAYSQSGDFHHSENEHQDQQHENETDTRERPTGFFDPFETVIDRDALNSPHELHEPRSAIQSTGAADEDEIYADDNYGEPIEFTATLMKIEDVTGIKISTDFDSEGLNVEGADDNVERFRAISPSPRVSPNSSSTALNEAAEGNVERFDVTGGIGGDDYDADEDTNSNTNANNDAADVMDDPGFPAPPTDIGLDESSEVKAQGLYSSESAVPPTPAPTPMHALPRPQAMSRPGGAESNNETPQHTLPQVARLAEPSGRANKRALSPRHRKRKDSFKEDSSEEDNRDSANEDDDDDEEDEKIQIVIKVKDDPTNARSTGAEFVPLLPPPPSKSSMKQAREKGLVEDMPSPVSSHRSHSQQGTEQDNKDDDVKFETYFGSARADDIKTKNDKGAEDGVHKSDDDDDDDDDDDGEFVIRPAKGDVDDYDDHDTDSPLYDTDTSYVLEEFPQLNMGDTWTMMLRYPPKKKLTSNRFWKKVFVRLVEQPVAHQPELAQQAGAKSDSNVAPQKQRKGGVQYVLKVLESADDNAKCLQEVPVQATYSVSDINSQQFDQYGKIFTIKLQYVFYRERVGVRPGQLARFMHTGHIGSSTTSGGHGVGPTSFGDIKRLGAPLEHAPQVSQIIKLGCHNYTDVCQFKHCLEDILFRMAIAREMRSSGSPATGGGATAPATPVGTASIPPAINYKAEEIQMGVRDEIYVEQNQVGTITKQLARVRLFFLSFLNGTPTVEVGINDVHRQGREVVGRHDILPVMTEEWIRLESCELHCTVDKDEFENPDSRIVRLVPPDATFLELMRFRVRPPRNRELPLQVSAHMTVTRSLVSIVCDVIVPGCISRKHGQIPCEDIAIRLHVPECWIYFFRTEKHFRYGSKKSTNRRPGKVKGIERFLGGGNQTDLNDASNLIEVTSGQAKYEHHHNSIVWRAARWPKESQSAYMQNTMKIHLPLTEFDKMPDSYYEYVHVEFTMPATTVSHTTLRSISVSPQYETPPEKYVKYMAKYEYKIKMRLSITDTNNNSNSNNMTELEKSPIVLIKPTAAVSAKNGHQEAAPDSDDAEPVSSEASDA